MKGNIKISVFDIFDFKKVFKRRLYKIYMLGDKKANIFVTTFLFLIFTVLYFLVGLPLMNAISEELIIQLGLTGIILYIAYIFPYVPFFALLYLAWQKAQPQEEGF